MRTGARISRDEIIGRLVEIQYQRNEVDFTVAPSGAGRCDQIIPLLSEMRPCGWSFGDEVERIRKSIRSVEE